MHPQTHTSNDRPTVGVIRRPTSTVVKVVLPTTGLSWRQTLDAAWAAIADVDHEETDR